MIRGLCDACKTVTELVSWDEQTHRGWCARCAISSPTPVAEGLAYLAVTVPFHVGDQVEARTAAEIYDGVGHVEEVSMSLEHGGTPIYPTFRVVIDQPAASDSPEEAWYTEICLQKVDN